MKWVTNKEILSNFLTRPVTENNIELNYFLFKPTTMICFTSILKSFNKVISPFIVM